MRNVILCGDVREQLRLLDAESVHCVVTSPPYWGLRDYGTAAWTGGDPECVHTINRDDGDGKAVFDGRVNRGDRTLCLKCGARRVDSQIGLEATPEAYVESMVAVFREVRRVLRKDGTVWLNLGDSYAANWSSMRSEGGGGGGFRDTTRERTKYPPAGLKSKDLVGIPWRVAFALQSDGWWLRSDIIWSKPNPMPESVTDRPTKAHEYIFLLSKSQTYYYDAAAIREPYSPVSIARISQPNFANQHGGPKDYGPDSNRSQRKTLENFARSHKGSTFTNGKTGVNGMGRVSDAPREDNPDGRNKRSVWEVATHPYPEAHFATYPPELIKPCILAGCPEGGVVLDPFFGSGTTGLVAAKAGRDWIGIELNPDYVVMAEARLLPVKARLL